MGIFVIDCFQKIILMRKYLLSAIIIFLPVFFTCCKMNVLKGEGNKTTTTPAVASFNSVIVELSLKVVVNVQEGAPPGIELSGYENLLKHITTKVEANTLTISDDLDETWRIECKDVVAKITVPSIAALTMRGATEGEIHGNMTGPGFNLSISGLGDVNIDNAMVDYLTVKISGAGNVRVKAGAVKTAEYRISGAGDIDAKGVQANEVKGVISGSGNIGVWAVQKLDAKVSGAGDITYKGSPVVTKSVSGSGSVTGVK
jgi:Putative auto-transporter adhesin, head GIN domain